MTLPSAKEIAKLAAACRKAGISTFKGGGIEFTLTDYLPEPKSKKAAPEAPPEAIDSDEPGYEQLLHWSVQTLDNEEKVDS